MGDETRWDMARHSTLHILFRHHGFVQHASQIVHELLYVGLQYAISNMLSDTLKESVSQIKKNLSDTLFNFTECIL